MDVLKIIKESDMVTVNDLGYVELEDRVLLKYTAGLVDKAHEELPEGQIPFKFITGALDRDSEVMIPMGAQLKNFKKNPVFLWAHNFGQLLPPIGKVVKMKKDSESFRGVVEFDLNDPFAKLIYEKYKEGFLNAVSVGFIPLAVDVEPRVDGQQGFTHTKYEVIEISGAPVPSNAEALSMSEWKEFAEVCSENGCDIMEKWVAGQMPEWGHKFYMGTLEGATKKHEGGLIDEAAATLAQLRLNPIEINIDPETNRVCKHKEFDEMNTDEDGLWKHCIECKKWVLIKDEVTELFSGDNPSKAIESTVNQLKETAESINKLSELLKPSEETAGQEIGEGVLDPSEIAREVGKKLKEGLTKE